MSSKFRLASRALRRRSLQAAIKALPHGHTSRPLIQSLEARTLLSTVTVTSGTDSGSGSLRAALTNAAPGDTIDFAPTVREVDLTTAGLTLTQNVSLTNDQGTGPVTIKGDSAHTVFSVNSGVAASISGLIITAGSGASGGGVYNDGTLTLGIDTITGNSAGSGAGIYNDSSGNLTLTNSTVSGNTTTGGSAGGINNAGGTVTMTGDTVSGNTGGQGGGGIAGTNGSLSITNCTIYNNSSPDNGGGGISQLGGSITLIDDTITGNSSQFGLGGGINSTVDINATGTLIAGNTDSTGAGDANAGFAASSSYNLIGDGTESFNITNGANGNQVGAGGSPINPKLDPNGPQNHGGPTPTIALLAGSPAIGAGVTIAGITTDQRGLIRPATPDIGAFQTPGSYTITVNDPADALDNPTGVFRNQLGSKITLRDAINAANYTQGNATIVLAKTTYDFTTVDNNWYGPDALPPVYSNITIQGNGATLQRDASLPQTTAGSFRFFYVSGGIPTELPLGTLTLKNLTLTNGLAKGGNSFAGGGGLGAGGAIFNQGNTTLNGVTLNGNTALGGTVGDTSLFLGSGIGFGGGGIGQDASNTSGDGGGFGGNFPAAQYGGSATDLRGGGGGFVAGALHLSGSGGGFSGLGGDSPNGGAPAGDGGGSWGEFGITDNGGDFGFGGMRGGGGIQGGGGGVGGGGGLGGDGGSAAGDGGFGGGGGAKTATFPFTGTTSPIGGEGGFGGGGGYDKSFPGAGSRFGGGAADNTHYDGSLGGGGAGMGGAIFSMYGSLTVVNSTLTANTAQGGSSIDYFHTDNDPGAGSGGSGFGGAVFNLDGTVVISFSTLAANTVVGGAGSTNGSADGGALYNLAFGNNYADETAVTATAALSNSILSGTIGGQDLVNQEVDGGYLAGYSAFPVELNTGNTASITASGPNIVVAYRNILGGPNGTAALGTTGFLSGVTNANLGLATSLADNGGPTRTIALLPGSKAIGTGLTLAGVTTDQRGVARPAKPDIGAVQTSGFTITATMADQAQSTPVGKAFANPLQVTVKAVNPNDPVAGGQVTYVAGVAPGGASAALSSSTATIAANGTASVTATANAISGAYSVTASTVGGVTAATFSLTNTSTYVVTALYDQTKANNSGSTVPITIKLTDAKGKNLGSSSLQIKAVSVTGPGGTLQSPGNSQPGNLFTFNPTTGTYQFNLKTTGYKKGTYMLNFIIGNDPTLYSVRFVIR